MASIEVTDAPDGNWAKAGDRFVLADKLAIDVFRQARVTAYQEIAQVSTSGTFAQSSAAIR